MAESALAIKCFVAGTTGVFLVMILLQVFVNLGSKLAIQLDAKLDAKAAKQSDA